MLCEALGPNGGPLEHDAGRFAGSQGITLRNFLRSQEITRCRCS